MEHYFQLCFVWSRLCLILSPFGRRLVRYSLSPVSVERSPHRKPRRPLPPPINNNALLPRPLSIATIADCRPPLTDSVRLSEHFLVDPIRYIRYEHRLRPWESLPRDSNFCQTTLSRRALIEPGQLATSTPRSVMTIGPRSSCRPQTTSRQLILCL